MSSEALSFPLGGIHDLHHRTSPCLGPQKNGGLEDNSFAFGGESDVSGVSY